MYIGYTCSICFIVDEISHVFCIEMEIPQKSTFLVWVLPLLSLSVKKASCLDLPHMEDPVKLQNVGG